MNPLRNPGFAILIIGDVALAGLLWLILRRLPPPGMDCIDPSAQSPLFALGILLALNLLAAIFLAKQYRWTSAILTLFFIITWWLGSYPYSPVLGLANGNKSALSGFRVTRSGRAEVTIAPGGVITLSDESPVYIEALVRPESARCIWQSAGAGAMDGPDTCNPLYVPPRGADFDLLKVHVVPGCQLPEFTSQLKISILP